jgi:hypothetical protein
MASRLWRVAHVLLTLTAVACCAWLVWREYHRPDPNRHSTGADFALRNFLDVKWIGGDYEMPKEEDHCALVVLKFEDGKFRGREGGTVFSPQPGGSRVVPFYVMWGRGPEGTKVVSGQVGFWGTSQKDQFFAKLDGGIGRAYGSTSLGEVRGYRVIGYGFSQQTQAGKERYRNISVDLESALDTRQAVVVLGLKPFPTQDEAKDWLYNHDEPADP